MSGRGMLFDEGPIACPFVALESDRDRRSAEPDPRHRCYAEPTPAPRALAHQREFCLSPEFGGCPIFRDWAIRAAAMPVPLRPVPRAIQQQEEEAARVAAEAQGGIERIPSLPLATDSLAEQPIGEEPARAPVEAQPEPAAGEPWAGESSADGRRADGLWTDERLAARAPVDPVAPDEPAAGPPERRRWTEDWPPPAAGSAPVPPPIGAAGSAPVPPPIGAAGSAPVPPPIEAGVASPPTAPQAGSGRHQQVDFAQRHESVPREPARSSRRDDWVSQRADLIPAWERERYAAYPTIGTRLGLGDAGALLNRLTRLFGIIAAIFLVFALLLLVPSFLGGFLAPGPSPTPTIRPTPVGSPTPAPTPTPTAEPTTGRYIIQAGDTMCRIARIHGLTYGQVLGANPQITNPSLIQAGQEIIIPADTFVPPTPVPGATPLIDPCG